LFAYLYDRWIDKISLNIKNESLIGFNASFNYNVFMKYKYRSLSFQTYSSFSSSDESNDTIRYGDNTLHSVKEYFHKNFVKNLKKRLSKQVYLIAHYEKVRRVRKRWYCNLVHGILTIYNQELIFSKGKARFDF